MEGIRTGRRGLPRWPCLLGGLLALTACASDIGHIAGAGPDTGFVESRERRYVHSGEHGAWLIVGLDGRIHRRLFSTDFAIRDVSADGRVFLLTNSRTDLLVARDGGREIREVLDFRKAYGTGALSPGGRWIAATKHPDFDKPQSQWVDDDTVYLIDTATREVKPVTRYLNNNNRGAAGLTWLDGMLVRLSIFGGPDQKIDLRTGKREDYPDGPDPLGESRRWKKRPAPPGCGMEIRPRGFAGDQGFEIVRPGETPRHLVVVEGRERGYHDISATVDNMTFTRDCAYIVFDFDHRIWVVELATGRVGPLLPGPAWAFERWYPIGLP